MVRLLGASWSTHFPADVARRDLPEAGLPRGRRRRARSGRASTSRSGRSGTRFSSGCCGAARSLTVVVQTALYCAVVIALVRDGAPGLALAGGRRRSPCWRSSGIAIQAKYAMWNTQILSESLAISLGFAAIAAWWRFAAAPTRGRARWALGVRDRVAPRTRRARAARDDRDRARRARAWPRSAGASIPASGARSRSGRSS